MTLRHFFLLFALSLHALQADVQDYFKKVPDKSGFHQMKNIDFIYTINLDQRPEKFATCTKQLNVYGIYPCRFSAVNGWELSLETINDLGVKYAPWMTNGQWSTWYPIEGDGKPQHEIVHEIGRTYFCHCMARGPIGIVLSHLSVLQDAYDSGYETIWVMEDDIEIIRNPHILSNLIEQLDSLVGKEGWDILFTDRDTKNNNGQYVPCTSYAWRPNFAPTDPYRFGKTREVSADLRQIGARYGAYSMIVRRSGMKKLLHFFKKYDVFPPLRYGVCFS